MHETAPVRSGGSKCVSQSPVVAEGDAVINEKLSYVRYPTQSAIGADPGLHLDVIAIRCAFSARVMMPMGAVSIKVKAPALQELNLKGQGLGDAGGNLRHQLLYATVGRCS